MSVARLPTPNQSDVASTMIARSRAGQAIHWLNASSARKTSTNSSLPTAEDLLVDDDLPRNYPQADA
jgi:hypothetical protein